jgi:LmbE family N-acetylglucosaminyl deacetylase
VATAVFFHAHPDDECIATAGTMVEAAANGHRVVLVTATRGEHGEYPEGFLADGEELWPHRVRELEASAALLCVDRLEFLGYVDSGMMGTPENDAAESFWQADLDEAAARLADILKQENAEVLTVYDDHGNYGHPDHIQVHRVGIRAAELAGTPRVFEATMNRDHMLQLMQNGPRPDGVEDLPDPNDDFFRNFGTPEADLTTAVDVTPYLADKRAAMKAHPSQIADNSFFLAMPDDAFAAAFGTEWYVRRGADRHGPPFDTSLFN